MTIPTQMSLPGFMATAPQLNFTGNGVARFYARVGVEHDRKETDGSFTKLVAGQRQRRSRLLSGRSPVRLLPGALASVCCFG